MIICLYMIILAMLYVWRNIYIYIYIYIYIWIYERITRFKGDIEDNGRLMRIEEQSSICDRTRKLNRVLVSDAVIDFRIFLILNI